MGIARGQRVADGSLHGSADTAAARILEYRDAGADGLNVVLRAPIDMELLDQYLDTIAPDVRSA